MHYDLAVRFLFVFYLVEQNCFWPSEGETQQNKMYQPNLLLSSDCVLCHKIYIENVLMFMKFIILRHI